MSKSLRGEVLDLDDAPAHGREVFVIDGNSLAHRAFHALPETIATSWGLPSNALLGFANLMFKLLCDYRPRAVAVAWDRRPAKRLDLAADYKAGRKPMMSSLAQQFPHFGAIVTAFGYENLALEGWEADDLLATIATRSEAAGLGVCVVSTDRDAFQLVSERTCLMMTPRGVSDVQVYTPERVTARYGIAPSQIPDFIALKGDASDNIPCVPGIGEKTAAELLVRFGSLEGVLAHAAELTPARRKALTEHAEGARKALELATMRRDLPVEWDPARRVAERPNRAALVETFTRFEFKKILERRHLLDTAIPAA